MQSIVSKLVAVAHHPYRHRIFHTRAVHSVFSSVPKSSQRIHNILPNSFLITHPLHHFHSFHHFTLSAETLLLRCRPNAHYFRGYNFNFNHSYHSCWRSLRSWLPGLTPNDMVLGLIITNVAVFLLWGMADEKFLIKNFTISLDNLNSGRLHTLITNAFSHRNTFHIFSNIYFGRNTGRKFGSEFLLKLYISGAVDPNIIPAKELASGASGAVNAACYFTHSPFQKQPFTISFSYQLLRSCWETVTYQDLHIWGVLLLQTIAWAGVRKGRF